MHKNKALNSQQSDDHSQQSQQENDSQYQVEQCFLPRVDRNLNYEPDFSKIIINTAFTSYDVVKEVALGLGMRVTEEKEETDWDLCWTDHPITPQTFIRMHFHQTINYMPGIHTIARKNQLGKRLNQMQSKIPKEYSFYPKTWMLPDDYSILRKYMQSQGKTDIFIVKPQASCQGKGIYLVNKLQDIRIGQHCVVQKYIDNPLLIQDYKFDLRVYVLIGSIDPLRIYVYHDGLARFATEVYTAAQRNNFKSNYQHLTNYAINKLNPKFKAAQSGDDQEGGFKRSIKAAFKTLADSGVDTDRIWQKIQEIAIKTIILSYEKIRNNYISSQPQQYHNHMSFHIIGLDIFIDNNQEPFLLQVNHTPSFATQTPLDTRIKTNLIKDTLVLMRCQDVQLKQELFWKAKSYSSNRISNGIRQTFKEEVRTGLLLQENKKREMYQIGKMGGYKCIFPCQNQELNQKYQNLIVLARNVLDAKLVVRKNSLLSQDNNKAKRKDSLLSQQNKNKRKDSIISPEKNTQKEVSKNQSQIEIVREKLQQKERERERQKMNIRATIKVANPEKKLMKDYRVQFTRGRNRSIVSQRQQVVPKLHMTLTAFIKNELAVIEQPMVRSALVAQPATRPIRAFTIKTKPSNSKVARKPSIRSIDPDQYTLVQKQRLKAKVDIAASLRGAFIKPTVLDVPSLVVTNCINEEPRVLKKKNKEGKTVFHVART